MGDARTESELLRRAAEVFRQVREAPVEAYAAKLDEFCGDDSRLRAEVESLLDVDQELPTVTGEQAARAIPKEIGRYRIRRAIASGGMGHVYEALQESPRRKVAVKVMRAGVTSRSALRRFEFESQILARLRHPNIAQIYEAGWDGDGPDAVPFFAMEYVPGALPLTQYVREKKIPLRERLAMFAKICEAIDHGHMKGIIHRDLKPGNLLVDSNGEVKIIDFGVARATDSDLAVTTLQTDVGQLIGTLQYMSPEQCGGDPMDVDRRSDVYSLGVVLYEMVCDCLPYDLTSQAIIDAIQVIRSGSPRRPSTVNTTLDGDVETIALKALEKERQQRYQSADALARDVRHFLDDEPIEARPPSLTYQIRMYARRHRGGIMTASVIAFLAIAAIALGVRGQIVAGRLEIDKKNKELMIARAAAAEASALRRAEMMHELSAVLVEFDREIKPLVGGMHARELVLGRALAVLDELEAETGGSLEFRADLASAYFGAGALCYSLRGSNTGNRERALDLHGKALEIREALVDEHPDVSLDLARSHIALGDWHRRSDRDRSTRHYERALAIADAVPEQGDLQLQRLRATALRDLAVLRRDSDPDAALDLIRRSQVLRERNAESADGAELQRDLAVGHRTLGVMLGEAADRTNDPGAAALLREQSSDHLNRNAEIRLELFERYPHMNWAVRDAYVVLADRLGDEEARPHLLPSLERAHERLETMAKADPANARAQRDCARAKGWLGRVHCTMKDHATALIWFERAIEWGEPVFGPADMATARYRVGGALESLDRLDDAALQYQESLRLAPGGSQVATEAQVAIDRIRAQRDDATTSSG